MNFRQGILSMFVTILFFSSCQKDVEYYVQDSNFIDSNWMSSVSPLSPVISLKQQLMPVPQIDSFDVATGYNFTFNGGTTANIPANGLSLSNGAAVSGRVAVEKLAVNSKGAMIRTGISTMNNGAVLINSGSFLTRLSKGGEALFLGTGAKINLHIPFTGQANQQNKLFFGEANLPLLFNWILNQDTANKVIVNGNNYEVLSKRTGWISCQAFEDTVGIAQSRINLALPSNFTNVNSFVYVAYSGQASAIEMKADIATRKFVSGNISVNKSISIVVISKQVNDYYLGTAELTTSAGAGIQSVAVIPVKKSLSEINSFLDSL